MGGADLAERLAALGRAAPKRGEALRALDACRAAWVWPDPVAPAEGAAEAPAAGCEAGRGAEAREEGQAGAGGEAVAVQAALPVDPGEVAIREAVGLARAAWEAAEARWAGRDALRESFEGPLSAIGVSILLVGTHVIDLIDEDHATGVQYSAGQVQEGDRWIHQAIVYRDAYERRGHRWFFARRVHELFHGVEAWTNPLDQPPADWPVHSAGRGTVPASFPTWDRFWAGHGGPPS